jgi:hypothetical protein
VILSVRLVPQPSIVILGVTELDAETAPHKSESKFSGEITTSVISDRLISWATSQKWNCNALRLSSLRVLRTLDAKQILA